jgi:hypothetical protein
VALIELCFTPNEDSITAVRRSLARYYQVVSGDEDVAARIAMAAHELLENAAKYSSDGFACLTVLLDRAAECLSVTLANRAPEESIRELRALFDQMETFPTAEAFYQSLMTHSGRRRIGSGLGLGRIMVEGEMKLSLDLRDDQVVIRAELDLENKAA